MEQLFPKDHQLVILQTVLSPKDLVFQQENKIKNNQFLDFVMEEVLLEASNQGKAPIEALMEKVEAKVDS